MSLCDSKLPITESNGIVQKACHHADEKQSSNWRRHSPTSPTTSSATPEPRRLLYCRACRTEQDLHHTSDAESANSLTQIQLLQQETISTHVEALRLGQVDVLLDTTASEHVDDPATPAAPPPPSTLPDALFEVRSSPLGGSGVFALQDLAFGQQILSETALLYADKINLYEEVDKLDPASRKLFDDLHAFKRTSSTDAIAARFWTNWYVVLDQHTHVNTYASLSESKSSFPALVIFSWCRHAKPLTLKVALVYEQFQDGSW